MKRIIALSALVLLAAAALPAAAGPEWTPLQIGFAGPPAQVFPEEFDVIGLRLNLFASRNENVAGIDAGFVSLGSDIQALRANLYNGSDYHFAGVEVGFVNHDAALAGLSVGVFNGIDGDGSGIQIGLFNRANVMTGLQIGFFNQATTLCGVQIGVINIIDDGPVTFLPILNMAF